MRQRADAYVAGGNEAWRMSKPIIAAIDPLLPEIRRTALLSQKALWILASTPGVTSVLNGMRTSAYVEDSLAILAWPPHPDPGAIYGAIPSL